MKIRIFNKMNRGRLDLILADGPQKILGDTTYVECESLEEFKELNPKWDSRYNLEVDESSSTSSKSKSSSGDSKKKKPVKKAKKKAKKKVEKKVEVNVETASNTWRDAVEVIKPEPKPEELQESNLKEEKEEVSSTDSDSLDLESMTKEQLNDLAAVNDVPGVSIYSKKPDMIRIIKEHLGI